MRGRVALFELTDLSFAQILGKAEGGEVEP